MVVGVVVLGALTPGYDHRAQLISELGARGAPEATLMRGAVFLPAGLLLLGFCAAAHRVLPRSALATAGLVGLAVYAAGYLVAAAFPLDPRGHAGPPSASAVIHDLGGGVGYLLAPASLVLLARAARGWPRAGAIAAAGHVAAGLALLGLVTLSPGAATAGLSQRLLELATLGWAAACGAYLRRPA